MDFPWLLSESAIVIPSGELRSFADKIANLLKEIAGVWGMELSWVSLGLTGCRMLSILIQRT